MSYIVYRKEDRIQEPEARSQKPEEESRANIKKIKIIRE